MTLPIAIILPHASLDIPPELNGRIALTPAHIFNEADVYTDQIFNFQDRVARWLYFPYARAVIDVNRPIDPALNRPGDGVVKQQTSYGTAVYTPADKPDTALENQLIAHYWQPWHNELESLSADRSIKLVIDCHSMAAAGPVNYDDPTRLRPRVSVGNLGDHNGELHPNRQRLSAPPAVARRFADLLAPRFADIPALARVGGDVTLNDPYFGGWDLWEHSGTSQPWLMVEINRALYVGEQTGETAVSPPNTTAIDWIRTAFWDAIEEMVATLAD